MTDPTPTPAASSLDTAPDGALLSASDVSTAKIVDAALRATMKHTAIVMDARQAAPVRAEAIVEAAELLAAANHAVSMIRDEKARAFVVQSILDATAVHANAIRFFARDLRGE